eukprot:jgi/Mesvir1/20039/Mv13290-RA.1
MGPRQRRGVRERIGKTLTREQIERLVATLYKELPAAFIKKTPTPTLCILVGDEVVGRLLMNMCKQALQGSPDAHERLVHIAFMLTKTSKDVLFRIPKEYLCEIISRATNTTQRVAMLQNTVDFHKRFGNEDFRDLGMRAGRAFADEAGDGPYDMQGGRGGGGRGGMPMFVNNVYPRGPIRRGNAGGGGNAAVYFTAPPNQNPWTHYGGQARTAHQAACCQVVQSAVNNAHRMRAESIAGALNPYTKVGKTEEPSPGVPGSSKDGNALRGDKVFGPGYLWGGLVYDEPPPASTPPPPPPPPTGGSTSPKAPGRPPSPPGGGAGASSSAPYDAAIVEKLSDEDKIKVDDAVIHVLGYAHHRNHTTYDLQDTLEESLRHDGIGEDIIKAVVDNVGAYIDTHVKKSEGLFGETKWTSGEKKKYEEWIANNISGKGPMTEKQLDELYR